MRPTFRPSRLPSTKPSLSSNPTDTPSIKPSLSARPSNSPTEIPTRSPINPIITEWETLEIDLANVVPLRAFACDPENGIEIDSPDPISPGESVAVCIRNNGPDNGYKVEAVYSAYVFGGPRNVTQTLFSAGSKVYSLASVDCSQNGMCILETNLDFDSFFSGSQPSTVKLSGVAILQLGRQQRWLQENPPELIGGDFQVQFQTAPADPVPILSQESAGERTHLSTSWIGSMLIVFLTFIIFLV